MVKVDPSRSSAGGRFEVHRFMHRVLVKHSSKRILKCSIHVSNNTVTHSMTIIVIIIIIIITIIIIIVITYIPKII